MKIIQLKLSEVNHDKVACAVFAFTRDQMKFVLKDTLLHVLKISPQQKKTQEYISHKQ